MRASGKIIGRLIVGCVFACGLTANIFGQMPPGFGGGSGTNNYTNPYTNPPPPYVPGLKVAVQPLTGPNLCLNLREADPVGTYDLFMASNLVSAAWNDVLSGTNGQTNFTLPFLFVDKAFFRAARMDAPTTNTAAMTAYFPNAGSVNNNITGAIFTGGPAAALAVLVNDPNLTDAVWIPFSSVPLVLLGTNDGTYQVRFGLIGGDGQTNWTTATVTLDRVPPVITITNPVIAGGAATTVAVPMIQLQGYANERLAGISYDLTNAAGIFTNQTGFVTGQFYDTNRLAFTTNYFQCPDVGLGDGANTITLHATDLAGNRTDASFTLNYSASTNPPALTIIWPPAGTAISGSSFTVQAQVDNPSATIAAFIVDAGGDTNTVQGLVEKNGLVWVQNLPLNMGTNTVTVTATGVSGNTSVTSFNIIKNDVGLVINPLEANQLNQSSVSVFGEIGDTNLCVWVNGVKATVNDDGTWEADNVPVSPVGTASLSVQVYVGDPVLVASQNQYQPQPVTVGLMSYSGSIHEEYQILGSGGSIGDNYSDTFDDVINWFYLSGGNDLLHDTTDNHETDYAADSNGMPPAILNPIWEYAQTHFGWDGTTDIANGDFSVRTHVMIELSGQRPAGQTNLYLVLANASEATRGEDYPIFLYLARYAPSWWYGDVPLPPEWLQIRGQTLVNTGLTNTDGAVWGCTVIQASSDANADVTPTAMRVLKNWDYTFDVQAVELCPPFVDANRDCNITFDSADQTSASNPYRFWVNNDYDSFDGNIGDYADLDPAIHSDANNTSIPCTRDLEDYTRLWLNTQGLTTNLQNGNLLLALEWKNTTGTPAIRLFPAVETNGGTLYLTNETTALAQSNAPYGNCIIDSYVGQDKVQGSLPFIIPTNFWAIANVTTNQPVAHLLFDAVSRGSGQLVIALYKNDGVTKLAEGPPLYLKLQDVKEMYDRYTVGDGNGGAVATTASLASGYSYDSTIPAENNYTLFVHGWNLAPWERDAFAETAFKRLYWQGYKGHFGAFQWPTQYGFTGWKTAITDPDNFDNSESNAWASATGLVGKLTGLNATYPGHVYLMAHSMGNVVAGEALKLAGSSQVVNTYVAMQGAISAHCYDASTVNRVTRTQPDRYAHYWTDDAPCYFNDTAGAKTCINFYNPNDYALNANHWQLDQDLKPDSGFIYGAPPSQPNQYNFYSGTSPYYTLLLFPVDRYAIFSYADPSWSYALGAQADVGGRFSTINQVDLRTLWPADHFSNDYKDHAWHSAEFNFDNMQQGNFWKTILGSQGFNLK